VDEKLAVFARAAEARYPQAAPFHPHESYPEYAFGEDLLCGEENFAYDAVRRSMHLAGLDAARFGTAQWNPLSEFIRPGQFVLLKPNLVKEMHPRDPRGWVYTITHGSVIRAVADYVLKALEGRGRVMVADAPQTDSSFSRMVELLQLEGVRDFYASRGLGLELVDLRKEEWTQVEEVIVERRKLAGDPNGYLAFDLASRSEFVGHHGEGRYYGADYDSDELNSHHTGGRHEYLISGSAIQCDVFINLPKLKTHKKAGITVNLKNLVGVNGDKNWLPHHTIGSPRSGGDQFPNQSLASSIEHASATTLRKLALKMPGLGTWLLRRARSAGKKVFGDTNKVVRSGNWYGNDTTWRMCLDLNKIVLFGNKDGTFRAPRLENQKTYLSFVDGILGGQGDGPMDPDPLESRLILFGVNPAAVDAAAAVLMGFEIDHLPIVKNAFSSRAFPIGAGQWGDTSLKSDDAAWSGPLHELAQGPALLNVRPHFGWLGHVEKNGRTRELQGV
jgi:uncharacterized protein (DUF362 family)